MTTPVYTPQTWLNGQVGGTPINGPRLSHMEAGIEAAEETLVDAGVKIAAYTAQPNDLIRCDTSAGPFAIQLPPAPVNGTTCLIKLVKAGNILTINRGGSDVFNIAGGSTAITVTKVFQSVWLEYFSGIWIVDSDGFPPDIMGVQATVAGATAPVEAWLNPYDAAAAGRALAMPTPTGPGRILGVMKVDSSANTVTVTGNFEGNAGTTLTLFGQWETMWFVSKADGSWWRSWSHKPKTWLDSLYTVGTRVATQTVVATATNATTVIADATGFTVTFTAVTGQTYEIRAKMYVSNNTAADGVLVQLTDAANAVLDVSPTIVSRTAGDQFLVVLQADVSPAAGSVTYKLRFNAVTGGTASINASATQKVPITVTRVS